MEFGWCFLCLIPFHSVYAFLTEIILWQCISGFDFDLALRGFALGFLSSFVPLNTPAMSHNELRDPYPSLVIQRPLLHHLCAACFPEWKSLNISPLDVQATPLITSAPFLRADSHWEWGQAEQESSAAPLCPACPTPNKDFPEGPEGLGAHMALSRRDSWLLERAIPEAYALLMSFPALWVQGTAAPHLCCRSPVLLWCAVGAPTAVGSCRLQGRMGISRTPPGQCKSQAPCSPWWLVTQGSCTVGIPTVHRAAPVSFLKIFQTNKHPQGPLFAFHSNSSSPLQVTDKSKVWELSQRRKSTFLYHLMQVPWKKMDASQKLGKLLPDTSLPPWLPPKYCPWLGTESLEQNSISGAQGLLCVASKSCNTLCSLTTAKLVSVLYLFLQ